MSFFKRKNERNVTRDNQFLKNYATRSTALLMYVEENEHITKEINLMIEDFQYTVPSMDTKAKDLEKKIKKEFDRLANMLEQTDCDEDEVVKSIKYIRRTINDIASLH